MIKHIGGLILLNSVPNSIYLIKDISSEQKGAYISCDPLFDIGSLSKNLMFIIGVLALWWSHSNTSYPYSNFVYSFIYL